MLKNKVKLVGNTFMCVECDCDLDLNYNYDSTLFNDYVEVLELYECPNCNEKFRILYNQNIGDINKFSLLSKYK